MTKARFDEPEPPWFPNEGDRQWWREQHEIMKEKIQAPRVETSRATEATGSTAKTATVVSQHTPGPWTVNAQFIKAGKIIVAEAFVYDADSRVVRYGAVGNLPQAANARLIAAAPEMYEALQRAVETIHAFHDLGMGARAAEEAWALYQQSPEMIAINTAIAKTEGR